MVFTKTNANILGFGFFLFSFLVFFESCSSTNDLIASYAKKNQLDDTTFVNIKDISNDFVLDMKYATPDNFLKSAVYDCPSCVLRLKTVKALVKANKVFMKKGLRIKFFDCYRPLDVQKKMWEIVPNPIYVANPSKGSIHNKGCAVDITLVDNNGVELNMGTSFDFFGEQAAHAYKNLPKEVLDNRALLKNTLIDCGFLPFDSEWWHYNLKEGLREKVSNFRWQCD